MSKRKTSKEFKDEVFALVGDEYTVLEEYINNKTKIKMRHNKCNKIFEIRPVDFISKNYPHRCPFCKSSKGEDFISKYLDEELQIEFFKEYRFKDCKYKKLLPFDFAIFSEDKTFIWLIEYDGEYHFKPINRCKDNSVNENNFKLTKLRDNIKNNYCKNNKNIALLRVNYTMSKEEIKEKIYKFLYSGKD